ncbi:RNA polymerase sigma-70 factor (ECF subfamily) [Pedobacter cryoconitis]|uniref:RNA polymerase sigma factor n=1 Tax=Pedobacter cryoconitis TaxID=188932 RepID=UPI001607FF94|nr:RNA polymerase sigma-70 factor [Pedobacter cryoconitis]MBB6273968.1 RNA polymerase sigma-70 factor (ECF subfamily) [Pedobacter cryoconitis]
MGFYEFSNYSKLTDTELAALLRSGDRLAFTEIYERYKSLLHRHAFKWTKDRDDAKDIIHEVFSNLWTKRETLSYSANLGPFLYAAVRNRIFNLLSHQRIVSTYIASVQQLINQGEYVTDHALRERELRLIIDKEIAVLPKKMQAVFKLSRNESFSHREIAEKLDLSEQTVRKHIQHALKILRVKLDMFILLFLLLAFRI